MAKTPAACSTYYVELELSILLQSPNNLRLREHKSQNTRRFLKEFFVKSNSIAVLLITFSLVSGCATAYTPDRLRTQNTKELCEIYYRNQLQSAREELIRRNEFDHHDWKSIDRKTVTPGMTETAVICSWGKPKRTSSTSTTYGTSKTFMYQACDACKLKLVVTDGSSVVLVQD